MNKTFILEIWKNGNGEELFFLFSEDLFKIQGSKSITSFQKGRYTGLPAAL